MWDLKYITYELFLQTPFLNHPTHIWKKAMNSFNDKNHFIYLNLGGEPSWVIRRDADKNLGKQTWISRRKKEQVGHGLIAQAKSLCIVNRY